jgi:hypothetical protein
MGKQPQLPGSRAKDVMCKRWDTPEFFSGKKKPLYTDEGISFVLQRSCEVIEMRSQWTPP